MIHLDESLVHGGWFKETIAFGSVLPSSNTAVGIPIFVQTLQPGVVIEQIVVRPKTRFSGTGLGMAKIDILDDMGNKINASSVRVGGLVNPASVYQVGIGSVVPAVAPAGIYARVAIEEALNGGAQTLYERSLITAIAGTALSGKYFTIHTDTYVWFNTGASTDPAPGGGFTTGIAVAISASDTATQVAGKLFKVLAALTSTYIASWDGATKVLLAHVAQTAKTDMAAGNTGFTVAKEVDGGGTSASLSALAQGEVEILIKFTNIGS